MFIKGLCGIHREKQTHKGNRREVFEGPRYVSLLSPTRRMQLYEECQEHARAGQKSCGSLRRRPLEGRGQEEPTRARVQANTKPRAANAAAARPAGAKRAAAPLVPCVEPVAVEDADAPVLVPAAEPEAEPVATAVGVADEAG